MELCEKQSFSDVERLVRQIRRRAVVGSIPTEKAILETISTVGDALPRSQRKQLAVKLRSYGLTERKVSEITGIARDTFRKELKKKSNKDDSHQTDGSDE